VHKLVVGVLTEYGLKDLEVAEELDNLGAR